MVDETDGVRLPAESEVYSESARLPRLRTGHEVLDQILNVYYGTSLLVLDETYSEARNFMQTVSGKYGPTVKFTEIADKQPTRPRDNIEILTGDSLADKVVRVNAIRRKHQGEVLVHSYLPSLLISQPQENVLRYVDSWKHAAKEFGTLEIYLMPSNSFKDVERKLVALLDSRIEFGVARREGGVVKTFMVSGACRPEYNMREFEYEIKDGRVLIEWEGTLTDKPADVSDAALERRFSEIREKPGTFILERGANASRASLSVAEFALVHQLTGMSALEISLLFPEKPTEIVHQLARWELLGVVSFRRDYSKEEGSVSSAKGSHYSLLNTLRLLLPDRLVAWSYKFGTQAVPLDYFMNHREALATAIDMLTENMGVKQKPDYAKTMTQIERAVLEISARRAALTEVPRHHESTATSAAKRYIPKILRIALLSAFILKSRIDKLSETEYHIAISDCYLCNNQESKSPMCSSISGGLEGVCGTVFKLKADCVEVKCKATGDRQCEFRLRLMA